MTDILPLVLSGRTTAALIGNVERLERYLGTQATSPPLASLCQALATTRTAFPVRLAMPVAVADAALGYPELLRPLRDFVARGEAAAPRA